MSELEKSFVLRGKVQLDDAYLGLPEKWKIASAAVDLSC